LLRIVLDGIKSRLNGYQYSSDRRILEEMVNLEKDCKDLKLEDMEQEI